MSAVVRVLEKAIAVIDKKMAAIEAEINARPLSALADCRAKASTIISRIQGSSNEKLIDELSPLIDEEKRLIQQAKRQMGTKLWDDKLALQLERDELQSALSQYQFSKRLR